MDIILLKTRLQALWVIKFSLLGQGLGTCFNQMVSILGFIGQTVYATPTQLCLYSPKTAQTTHKRISVVIAPINLNLWTLQCEFYIIFTS